MTIQVTIIGLGQIGSSVGLALGNHKDSILRVGHDRSSDAVDFAQANDVVDRAAPSLSEAVQDADIILLALPFHEIYPILGHIAQDLKVNALVLDTAPLKTTIISWVKELLPESIHYVGLLPVIGTRYLDQIEHGPQTAQDDLFKGNLMALVTSQTASEEALNAAVNFVGLLGAIPYFPDPVEIDGVVSMTHLLPQLLAAVMLDVSQNAPGWQEGRKIAGKAYSQLTNSFTKQDIPQALAAELTFNQSNINRLINDVIRCLVDLRDGETSPGQSEMAERFHQLQAGRTRWLEERQKRSWDGSGLENLPPKENILSRMLGFRRPPTQGEDR